MIVGGVPLQDFQVHLLKHVLGVRPASFAAGERPQERFVVQLTEAVGGRRHPTRRRVEAGDVSGGAARNVRCLVAVDRDL